MRLNFFLFSGLCGDFVLCIYVPIFNSTAEIGLDASVAFSVFQTLVEQH